MESADVRNADVPDVVAPPPHHPRFPLTVGLRGLPVLGVIVVHAWAFSGGFGGYGDTIPNRAMVRVDGVVAVFFLLSAFLLYRPMIAYRTGGPPAPSVSDYARRRFLRLYPPYWVALTALAIFPGLFGVFSRNWWAFYSLTDYLHLELHSVCPASDQFRCALPQSWTLGVDMTFYMTLPLYCWATRRLARGRDPRSWMRIELALLGVLATASLYLGGPPFALRQYDWYRFSVLGHFYWFALGLAIAVVSVAYRPDALPSALRAAASRPLTCWGAAFLIYLITVGLFYPAPFIVAPFQTHWEYTELNLLQGLAAALVFIPAVFGNPNRGPPARILGHPMFVWIGLISYELLLWNVTFAVILGSAGNGYWVVLLGGLVVSVPLAALSYYVVERPLMKLKYRPLRDVLRAGSRRSVAPVPGAGSPP